MALLATLIAACRPEPEPRPEPAQLRPASEPEMPAPAPVTTAFAPEEIDPASLPDPVFHRATPALRGPLPGDDAPIDLPEAPPGWPRWDSAFPPPASMDVVALEEMAFFSRHLRPVPSWDAIPLKSTRGLLDYDRFIFNREARSWAPRDLQLAYGEGLEKGAQFMLPIFSRTWSVDMDGGRVVITFIEAGSRAVIRIRPHEWLDASLEERLGWARIYLPRLLRLRGFDEEFKRRPDVDLRWRRTGPASARLSTATWSQGGYDWFRKIIGYVDDDGITARVRRRHRYGDQRFGP